MNKAGRYREALSELAVRDWSSYLLAESGLPGPRANLELVQAVADSGDKALFERFLAYGPDVAPTNTPQAFLALCGIAGLGRILAEGEATVLDRIRHHANDPRWRMREGVVMALERLGHKDLPLLMDSIAGWQYGTLLEQRALIAVLCHPALLADRAQAKRVLTMLNEITARLSQATDRRCDEFKVLRKGLGYCWSVAVVACPEMGKPLMENWMVRADRDVIWVMKQNLRKNRLARLDLDWVHHWKIRLGVS